MKHLHSYVSYQHDPRFVITIYDSGSTIIIHNVAAAAAMDLQTIKQKDSREEVKSVTSIDETLIYSMW